VSIFCAAVDWGTTSFRLWVLTEDGVVLDERRSNDGLLSIEGRFESVLEDHLIASNVPTGVPVVICGMAGSRNGWREAAYLNTPCSLAEVSDAAMRIEGIDRDVRILPGIAQAEPADVMRGEETQLLGLGADGTICLPGTHSKWVTIRDGRLEKFSTWMTGELFSLLSTHSLLAADVAGCVSPDEAFFAGLNRTLDEPEALTNALFGLRANALLGQGGGEASKLSGMLIGSELVGVGPVEHVTLIGDDGLGDLYAAAFDAMGTRFTRVDATTTTQAGLLRAAQEIWMTEAA